MAGVLQRIAVQEFFCRCIVFQVRIPESQRSRVGIPQNRGGLRRASGVDGFCGNERHVTCAPDEYLEFIARLAAFEWSSVPSRICQRTQVVERAINTHKLQRHVCERVCGQAELSRALRRETKNCLHARIRKILPRMVRKIDQRPTDSFRGISAHGMSGYPYASCIDFSIETRDTFLQTSERIQNERNVPRSAFPERGILKRFGDGLSEACVLVTAAVSLSD